MQSTVIKTSKVTLETIAQSIGSLREHIDEEIHGLAFLVAKTEKKLIERLDKNELKIENLEEKIDRLEVRFDLLEDKTDRIESKIDYIQEEMKSGFQKLEKTKISYNSPIKVKKSTKSP